MTSGVAENVSTTFQDVYWRSKDGLRLHAREYGHANGKLPVICIPGLTRNCRDFETVAPWIADQGRRVLAIDLRGRGGSDRDPNPKNYQPKIYADDVCALLASFAEPRALFVGTSLGGLVTMTLAMRRPQVVGGAVINDVGPRVAKSGLARIASYAGKSVEIKNWSDAQGYVRRTNAIAFPDYQDSDWAIVARRLFKEDENGRPMLDYDRAIFRRPPPLLTWILTPLLWAAFKKLGRSGPLLIIRGAASDVLDAQTLARMKRTVPAAIVAEIPGIGHAPMLDEPASQSALAAFIARTP